MSDDSTTSRRRFLQATGGTAAAAALAGCFGGGGGGDGTTGTGTGTGGGTTEPGVETGTATSPGGPTTAAPGSLDKTLREINGTITTFDPIAATDTASGRIIQQVFDALTNYKNGTTATTNLLAKSVERSSDFKTYTFKLKDAKFHNGKEVTAQDFIYSFERLAASSKSRRAYFILSSMGVKHETDSKGNYKPGTLALSAPDKKTLKIELATPFHATLQMLAYTAFAALPEGIVGDIKGYDGKMEYKKFAQKNPIGAGPFKFKNWKQGTSASVTRYKNYHGQKALVGGVQWQVIEKDSPYFNYAMNKNADIFGIPTSKFDPSKVSLERTDKLGRKYGTYGPARNGETLNMLRTPLIVSFYVGFNMEQVPKPVRQAMAYVLNQKQLVNKVFKNRGATAYHFTPPSIYPGGAKAYRKHAKNGFNSQTKYGKGGYPYGYNKTQIDKARQVMEDAGYSSSNQYTLNWTQYQSGTWLEMAKILRDQLASAHVDMQIEQAPFSTLLKRGRNGNLDAYTLGWIADWPAPDNFLQLLNPPQTDTSEPGAVSYINWSSKTGDAASVATNAYETVTANPEPTDSAMKKRQKAYIKMEEANWEDVGFVNVYHSVGDRFWYDWLDFPASGPMGQSRQMRNRYTIKESDKRPE